MNKPKESPLGAAVRKVREGPTGAEVVAMIRAFNEGKFETDVVAKWPETPPYASSLAEWETLARDFYNARLLNTNDHPTAWEDLPKNVADGWRLATHDFYWPLARQQGRTPASTHPDLRGWDTTACGNPKHPRGPWHPAACLPASWQWAEIIRQWWRRRRYGCGCRP